MKPARKTARERINALLDENSFVELNAFAETRSIDFDMREKESTRRWRSDSIWFY